MPRLSLREWWRRADGAMMFLERMAAQPTPRERKTRKWARSMTAHYRGVVESLIENPHPDEGGRVAVLRRRLKALP